MMDAGCGGIVAVANIGCVPERSLTPPVMVAPASLEVTMDLAVHVIVEDDAR